MMLKMTVQTDQGRTVSSCAIAPPGHGANSKATIRVTMRKLRIPSVVSNFLIACTPMKKMAREIKRKKPSDARLWGMPVVRGNRPIAANEVEPSKRHQIPSFPGNAVKNELFPRPMANIRLNTPLTISPILNSPMAGPSTPKTLR